MKHTRNITMKRITFIEATLDDAEIERALAREVLLKVDSELVDRPGVTVSVRLDRSYGAEVSIRFEQEVVVAPEQATGMEDGTYGGFIKAD